MDRPRPLPSRFRDNRNNIVQARIDEILRANEQATELASFATEVNTDGTATVVEFTGRGDSTYLMYSYEVDRIEYAFLWETYWDEDHRLRASSHDAEWYDTAGPGMSFPISFASGDPRRHVVKPNSPLAAIRRVHFVAAKGGAFLDPYDFVWLLKARDHGEDGGQLRSLCESLRPQLPDSGLVMLGLALSHAVGCEGYEWLVTWIRDQLKKVGGMSEPVGMDLDVARFLLGRVLEEGLGGPVDLAQARKLYEDADAASGYPPAQVALGNLFYSGKLNDPDLSQAASWYEKAAAQGDEVAMFDLGMVFIRGGLHGQNPDYAAAYRWLLRAARAGKSNAQAWLDALARELGPERVAAATNEVDEEST